MNNKKAKSDGDKIRSQVGDFLTDNSSSDMLKRYYATPRDKVKGLLKLMGELVQAYTKIHKGTGRSDPVVSINSNNFNLNNHDFNLVFQVTADNDVQRKPKFNFVRDNDDETFNSPEDMLKYVEEVFLKHSKADITRLYKVMQLPFKSINDLVTNPSAAAPRLDSRIFEEAESCEPQVHYFNYSERYNKSFREYDERSITPWLNLMMKMKDCKRRCLNDIEVWFMFRSNLRNISSSRMTPYGERPFVEEKYVRPFVNITSRMQNLANSLGWDSGTATIFRNRVTAGAGSGRKKLRTSRGPGNKKSRTSWGPGKKKLGSSWGSGRKKSRTFRGAGKKK